MIVCKLTGKSGKGVKAHVLPMAFYELPQQEEGPLKLVTNTPGIYPKRAPIGIYDQNMVTRDGEERFGPWDDYACQILLQRFKEFIPITDGQQIGAWRLPDVDYSLMKLFALSVLWRAHASTHPAFAKVDLGAYEPRIRRLLLEKDPGAEEQFSVCIVRWIDDGFGPVFMNPFRERYDGVNFYRVYCGRYVIYIKVDQRKTGPKLRELQLAQGRDLYLVARDLKASKEWPIMANMTQANAPALTSHSSTPLRGRTR